MSKVYIDLGHGGSDCGAIGVNNLKEADINLQVGLKVIDHLNRCKLDVKASRINNSTKSLSARTNEANTWKADCLVSIHCNAYNKTAKGVETIAYKNSLNNLATMIHEEVIKTKAYTINRGVKEQNLHVLRESNCRAALIEMAFIDNVEDAKLLIEKQDLFAEAIAKGICRYLKVSYVEVPKPSNPSPTGLYAVCVGAYGYDNAKRIQEEVKAKGYKDAYLIPR